MVQSKEQNHGVRVRGSWPGPAGLVIFLNPAKGGSPCRRRKTKAPLTRELFLVLAAAVRTLAQMRTLGGDNIVRLGLVGRYNESASGEELRAGVCKLRPPDLKHPAHSLPVAH